MNRQTRWIYGAALILLTGWLCGRYAAPVSAADDQPLGSYEAEKAKALANPYANDAGPATLPDDVIASYPPDIQNTYKNIFLIRCSRCHQPSRPLNSQFVEPSGTKEEQQAKIAKWKAEQPEIFKDHLVWQIEGRSEAGPGVWERYVKKMMAKPGCNISRDDGKKIWQFLTYDSEHRKTGANAVKWAAHRRKLLADFKTAHPDRYRELYETN